jgi:hypothetical protein
MMFGIKRDFLNLAEIHIDPSKASDSGSSVPDHFFNSSIHDSFRTHFMTEFEKLIDSKLQVVFGRLDEMSLSLISLENRICQLESRFETHS